MGFDMLLSTCDRFRSVFLTIAHIWRFIDSRLCAMVVASTMGGYEIFDVPCQMQVTFLIFIFQWSDLVCFFFAHGCFNIGISHPIQVKSLNRFHLQCWMDCSHLSTLDVRGGPDPPILICFPLFGGLIVIEDSISQFQS